MGLLAVCAPPAQAAMVVAPVSVPAVGIEQAPGFVLPFRQQFAPPGPVLPETARVDSQQWKNKLIAGGVAVVLLLLVLWGRRVRSHKRKKTSDQAKGK
jgi:hypothetical protein